MHHRLVYQSSFSVASAKLFTAQVVNSIQDSGSMPPGASASCAAAPGSCGHQPVAVAPLTATDVLVHRQATDPVRRERAVWVPGDLPEPSETIRRCRLRDLPH